MSRYCSTLHVLDLSPSVNHTWIWPSASDCEVRRSICRFSRSTSSFSRVLNSSFLHSITTQLSPGISTHVLCEAPRQRNRKLVSLLFYHTYLPVCYCVNSCYSCKPINQWDKWHTFTWTRRLFGHQTNTVKARKKMKLALSPIWWNRRNFLFTASPVSPPVQQGHSRQYSNEILHFLTQTKLCNGHETVVHMHK